MQWLLRLSWGYSIWYSKCNRAHRDELGKKPTGSSLTTDLYKDGPGRPKFKITSFDGNPFSEFRFVFKGGGSNFRKLDTDYFDVIDGAKVLNAASMPSDAESIFMSDILNQNPKVKVYN